MSDGFCYLDSSALVKLVVPEPETDPLLAFLRMQPRQVTSRLATIEVPRALARRGPTGQPKAVDLLASMDLVELDHELALAAAVVEPVGLRTLDAIHLATAMALRDDLSAVVSYDRRLVDAARAAGLLVLSPA